eukprot:GHVS01050880.1.p1 GENE.GHVS01050880.1~~GHVS01050880.1.p1  ORF type:complete len:179 (+),score=45.39 GHVS01050880.1:424-960(+)
MPSRLGGAMTPAGGRMEHNKAKPSTTTTRWWLLGNSRASYSRRQFNVAGVLFVFLNIFFFLLATSSLGDRPVRTASADPSMEGVRVVGGGEGKGQAAGGGSSVGHSVTPEEFDDYKRDFMEFDLNRDGLIDAHELRAAFQQDKVEAEELYQFFMDVDTDSSGTVTEMEYLEYALNFHS